MTKHRFCCCGNEPCIDGKVEGFIKIEALLCIDEYLAYQDKYNDERDKPSFWVRFEGPCVDKGEGPRPDGPVIRDFSLDPDIENPTGDDVEEREILFGDTESVFMSDPLGNPAAEGEFENPYTGMTRREDNLTGFTVSASLETAAATRNAFRLTNTFLRTDQWLDLDEDRIVFNSRPYYPANVPDHTRAIGPGAYIFSSDQPYKKTDAIKDENGEALFSPLMQQIPYGENYGIVFFSFASEPFRIMAYDFKPLYPDGFESKISGSYQGTTDPGGEFPVCHTSTCDSMQTGQMKFYAGAIDAPNPDTIDPSTGQYGTGRRTIPALPTFVEKEFGNCRRQFPSSNGQECPEFAPFPYELDCGQEGFCHGMKEPIGEIKGGYGQDSNNVIGGYYRTIKSSAAGGSDTLRNRLLVFRYSRRFDSDSQIYTHYCMASETGICALEPAEVTANESVDLNIPTLSYGNPIGSPANPFPNSQEPPLGELYHYASFECTNIECLPPFDCRCFAPDITLIRHLLAYSPFACNGIGANGNPYSYWYRATNDPNFASLPGLADNSLLSGCNVQSAPRVEFPN